MTTTTYSRAGAIGSFVIIGICVAIAISILSLAPAGVDWHETYARLGNAPYKVETFYNPAFVLYLLPHRMLPENIGGAINRLLNILAIAGLAFVAGRNKSAVVLALTSPMFIDLMRTNNIDWIPAIGLLVSATDYRSIGILMLLAKPQVFGAALVMQLKDLIKWRSRWLISMTVVPVTVLVGSLLAYGWWIPEMLNRPSPVNSPWNFSMWPLGIVIGLVLLRQAWREDNMWLAAVSTYLLTPYLAAYSGAAVLAVAAGRWPKIGQIIWLATWAYVVIEMRRVG